MLLFLFSFPQFLFPSDEVEKLFLKGNESFQNRDYEEAAAYYERILELGYEGVPLFYNLGNTYYRLARIGMAILNYERALRLSPGDEDISYNLAIAYSRTIDQLQVVPRLFILDWIENLLAMFSIEGWTIFSYLLFLLTLFAFSVYFFSKKILIQKWGLFSSLAAGLFFLFTAVILFVNVSRDSSSQFAIMIENRSEVKLSPERESGDAFIIHEGIKVKIEDELDEWKRIRLSDGKSGWILKNKLIKI